MSFKIAANFWRAVLEEYNPKPSGYGICGTSSTFRTAWLHPILRREIRFLAKEFLETPYYDAELTGDFSEFLFLSTDVHAYGVRIQLISWCISKFAISEYESL